MKKIISIIFTIIFIFAMSTPAMAAKNKPIFVAVSRSSSSVIVGDTVTLTAIAGNINKGAFNKTYTFAWSWSGIQANLFVVSTDYSAKNKTYTEIIKWQPTTPVVSPTPVTVYFNVYERATGTVVASGSVDITVIPI